LYAQKHKLMPVNRVETACLTFPSALVSSIEYECPREVYSFHPCLSVESFKTFVPQEMHVNLRLFSNKADTLVSLFRCVSYNNYEYWKVGKSRIGISTMKLRIADVMTQDVRVNDLRFWTLKIFSPCCLFHNLYLPFSCHSC